MNTSSRRRRILLAATAIAAAWSPAAPPAGAHSAAGAWQLDGRAGAEIVAGLEFYDLGAVVVVPSGRSGPATADATVVTGDDLPPHVDFIGSSVASGDVDGDGYADLVTSGADYSSDEDDGTEVVVVMPGGPRGVEPDDAYIVTGNPHLGGQVLVADLDRDGVHDVVAQSVRSVTVLWGDRSRLSLDRSTRVAVGKQRRFGELMAAGNVDGDPQRELVVGQGGRIPDNEGTGRARGRLNVCDVRRDRTVSCDRARRIPSGARTIAVGDFVGDNRSDVVLGEPVTDESDDAVNHPALWLYRGTREGLGSKPAKVVRGRGGVPGRPDSDAAWGSALAAGDVDADGKDDLAVGAPWDQRGGSATLVYGHRKALGASSRDRTISQATPGVPGADELSDGFGEGLSLLDVTGDGRLDLLVGVPGEDRRSGAVVTVPSRRGRLAPRRSVRFEAGELGLDRKGGEIGLGELLGGAGVRAAR